MEINKIFQKQKGLNVGLIAGGAIGGTVLLVLAGSVFGFLIRKHRSNDGYSVTFIYLTFWSKICPNLMIDLKTVKKMTILMLYAFLKGAITDG